MAGYSGTPLPKKLGIKPGQRLALLGAPKGFLEDTLGPRPAVVGRLTEAGGFWVAWPAETVGPAAQGPEKGFAPIFVLE